MRRYKENPHDRNNWSGNASKEIKEKTMKFRLRMILIFVIILTLAVLLGGCITKRGHKLGGGFIKGDDGVWRRPSPTQVITPAPTQKSKPVPIESTYDPPTTEQLKESAVPTPDPVVVKAQPENLPPIKIEPKKEINLGLIKIKLPESVTEEPASGTDSTGEAAVDSISAVIPTEKEAVKVHWANLFIFYLNSALVLFFIYFIYKIIKGEVLWKEPEINKHIKNLGDKKNVKPRNTRRTKKVPKKPRDTK